MVMTTTCIFLKTLRVFPSESYLIHVYMHGRSLRKQPTFGDATTGVSAKLVVPRGKFDSTNQKHYPDQGSDASSV